MIPRRHTAGFPLLEVGLTAENHASYCRNVSNGLREQGFTLRRRRHLSAPARQKSRKNCNPQIVTHSGHFGATQKWQKRNLSHQQKSRGIAGLLIRRRAMPARSHTRPPRSRCIPAAESGRPSLPIGYRCSYFFVDCELGLWTCPEPGWSSSVQITSPGRA